jgi:RNA polymerase sigma-70 factor (ECF subfamily)
MTDEDSELILLSKKGRMDAFRKLVEKYKRPAYFIALGLVGNRDDAYDLSQEAFIRVYRSLPRFDPRRKFFSWFYVILSNLCKNHLRGKQVREEYVRDRRNRADYRSPEDTAPGPDVLLEQDEAGRRLWREIEKLPFEFKEIIVLKHFQGLSYKEISAMLDIPIGTVMSRLYHARKKLKDNLQTADGMRAYEV